MASSMPCVAVTVKEYCAMAWRPYSLSLSALASHVFLVKPESTNLFRTRAWSNSAFCHTNTNWAPARYHNVATNHQSTCSREHDEVELLRRLRSMSR